MRRSTAAVTAFALAWLTAPTSALAVNAYITNVGSGNVSVIDTATNTVIGSPIPVGSSPDGVAVTPDGKRHGAEDRPHPCGVDEILDRERHAEERLCKVYVTNFFANTVSVIDTATNAVVGSPIPVGSQPTGVAATPDGSKVYVANEIGNTVSVIDTVTDTVIGSQIPVGNGPGGVAVTADGSKVYVANLRVSTVSVIDTATNTVIGSPIPVDTPFGVAVTPAGKRHGAESRPHPCGVDETLDRERHAEERPCKVYVTSDLSNTVSVIDTATNTVIGSPIPVGVSPTGVAVTPDGSKVYVANELDNTVSVIDTATNMVTATIPVGSFPFAVAIQPGPRFAGTPGFSNCHGQSVAAVAQQFGGLNAAAVALGFPSVQALQTAIRAFCQG